MADGANEVPTVSEETLRAAADDLRQLVGSLPAEALTLALTHTSWVDDRELSYARLAFLGDRVLGLGVAEALYRSMSRADVGRLAKVQSQAVSGRACAVVAVSLQLDIRLEQMVPPDLDGAIDVATLLASERALSSITEAVIGSCYFEFGFQTTVDATVAAFQPHIDLARSELIDFKSALQEDLAQDGRTVRYKLVGEEGPAHARVFSVAARVEDEEVGRGSGTTKKNAEQAAAAEALEARKD